MAKESGIQNTWYGITCWKVYAQGLASGWAGIMRYGAMFWTPLIVFFIMKGRSSSEGASSEELKHAGRAHAAPCQIYFYPPHQLAHSRTNLLCSQRCCVVCPK